MDDTEEMLEEFDKLCEKYAYENIDDTILSDVDISNGIMNFRSDVYYYSDIKESTKTITTLTTILDDILDVNSEYKMRLISKNNIPNFNKVNVDFDCDESIIFLPNVKQCGIKTID